MEQFLVLKKNVTMCYLCKTTNAWPEFSFRKNDATVFFSKKEAVEFYKKAINKEFSANKKETSSYYHITKKVLDSRRIFNKKLKEKVTNKYEIKPVKIGSRVLAIEKM